MILLTSTSDLIEITTGSTQTIQIQTSYVDLSGSTVTPGRTNTQVTTATTTTIVASPASSTQRTVKFISIQNTGGAAETVTVIHTDGTTPVQLQKISLVGGYTLVYNEGSGWTQYDTNGNIQQSIGPGRYLGTTILSSSSGTFTTQAATTKIYVRGVAGGGAGGGVTSLASDSAAGGGGGAGSYLESNISVSGSTGYSYTCGAGGTGVSGAAGNNGNNSTIVVGATTYTCNAGGGAPVATSVATLISYAGGAGGALSTNGQMNCGGQPGEYGSVVVVDTATGGCSGSGGSSPFGGGGLGTKTDGNGANAIGFGGGGGGSVGIGATARTGGNGSAGCWIVDEFS